MTNIVKCLQKIGYRELTSLQKKAFKAIYNEKNSVIIVAPTGSGKTEAALLPIMYRINKYRYKPISAIYITPLRALNRDIKKRMEKLAKCFGVSINLRHGDTPYKIRKYIEANPPHILVTTPETFNYILINNKMRKHLANLKYIVIDEFRDLIENKRGILLLTSIYLLEHHLRRKLIKIALTATLKNINLAMEILSSSTFPSNVDVLIDNTLKPIDVKVVVPQCKDNYKCKLLGSIIDDEELIARILRIYDLFRSKRSILIFVNTRSIAEKLGYLLKVADEKLGGNNVRVEVHHGSLSRNHRLRVEEDFRNGYLKGLIATSSMELGIDIGFIDYVIQYMSPRQVVRLVQRIGRSGHKLFGVSRGEIIVQNNTLQILESLVIARRAINNVIEEERIPVKPLDVLAYSIVLYSLFTGGINIYDLYSLLIMNPIYRDLDVKEFNDLIEYLKYARLIKVRDNIIKPTSRSKLFIYKTSMIPFTKDVIIINIVDDRRIGVLNEEYVVLNISEGDIVVIGGKPWKVIGYDQQNAKLYVEPYSASENIVIPHWEGENIPVEYKLAREVGSLIRRISSNKKIDYYKTLLLDDKIKLEGINDLADDKTIIIEGNTELGLVIVNINGGSRVNRFMRDLLKSVVQWRYPFLRINAYSTPYAVFITLNNKQYVREVVRTIEQVIHNINRYLNHKILKRIAIEQGTIHWRIFQVAQRFGAIDPEKNKITRAMLEAFVDTVIGYEALNEILWKDYDIESIRKLADLVINGKIKVVSRITSKLTNGGRQLVTYYGEIRTVMPASLAGREKYLQHIMKRRMSLICLHCGYVVTDTVSKLVNIRKCPRCGYMALAPVKGDAEKEAIIVKKALNRTKLSRKEKAVLEDLRKRAILYSQFGELALKVLASRGVGVSEAIRVINRVLEGHDLYSELYESEKKYLRIKTYLKDND
ncbi:DEAD/DEAH box helicase [Staphylothermus hellenicus]|uniref:DEAD/DEAH box helicase domain protein n=1 Tax=Staphylothermus hellenicus (strain DSM 12710 / JCM 10830 / BK20S6-10-b1 / P8) TaxID=591019 RepID=D7D9U7_STAHD|nr:DEAD/DEAH box helicase [Staphylothermus hellenicus]ADI32543.1 DEAD/DEAH box helicase domain protein [Staphylothermus hellenicus DSM 12710]